jgi:hypothetical protein
VSASAKDHILPSEPGHFGHAQPGLDRHEKKGTIAPAKPGALIRCCQQGLHFRPREELDQASREPFVGNGEHPLDLCSMGGKLERGVPKEGMERGEAQIPSAHADSVPLHVIQKRHDQGGVDILESQT